MISHGQWHTTEKTMRALGPVFESTIVLYRFLVWYMLTMYSCIFRDPVQQLAADKVVTDRLPVWWVPGLGFWDRRWPWYQRRFRTTCIQIWMDGKEKKKEQGRLFYCALLFFFWFFFIILMLQKESRWPDCQIQSNSFFRLAWKLGGLNAVLARLGAM